MTPSIIPITLTGSNLGERHHEFNLLVDGSFLNGSFEEFISQPERSTIDRVFKIDLASKHRNVDYILQNLKDSEMLYVSRSLKCLWLLEPQYNAIINPHYLEDSLYPEMIQPAVHKMKNWLSLHLKESKRCEEFYNYYKCDFNSAFKFLRHCSCDFILNEFPDIMEKLSFKHLNLLLETCPQAGKLYFEMLPNNCTAICNYVKHEYDYFSSLKHLLYWDGDVLLDIVEKYFNIKKFHPFGPSFTKHIMRELKDRVIAKCELYVSSILHINSLATHLTAEEARQIVLRLAQADYLKHWFSYRKVEPLIKRLKLEDRSVFKNEIFNKLFCTKVKGWPYLLPSPVQLEDLENINIFDDILDKEHSYFPSSNKNSKRRFVRKRKRSGQYEVSSSFSRKNPLDHLFNRYRVTGFKQTFNELSMDFKHASLNKDRLSMILVLVSKTGGVPGQVKKLMQFLVERHKNEGTTLRAAVVRSLMKRCCAWRLSDDIWALILEFGRDVGLDGSITSPFCREGLHAVVIRYLLANKSLSPTLLTGFIRVFSNFSEYKLNAEEKKIIGPRLTLLILPSNPNGFLDCLSEYKLDIKHIPEAKHFLVKAAKEDSRLLKRMYNSKILRRELLHETFTLKQSDEAYLNVLHHDIHLLENGHKFALLVSKKRPNHNRFLRSLNLYFSEPSGLAEKHRYALEEAYERKPQPWFARPLCILMTDEALIARLSAIQSKERPLDLKEIKFLYALRSNAHITKPSINIDAVDWKLIGANAVSNKVLICRAKTRDMYLKKLLQWDRTARIALRLSIHTPSAVDNFVAVCTLNPAVALKVALSFYLTKTYIEPQIWNALKTVIENQPSFKKKRSLEKMCEVEVAENIEADYWTFIYKLLSGMNKWKARSVLWHLEKNIHKIDPIFSAEIIKDYIQNDITMELSRNDDVTKNYVRFIAKYLLLYHMDAENICDAFFDAVKLTYNTIEDKNKILNNVKDFIFALKYTKAFLDQENLSLLNTFERILKRLHDIFPKEQFFDIYVEIHLTILYFKAINQAMKKNKELFDNTYNLKAVELIGFYLGENIGYEIKEVVSHFFWSVIDLYKIRLKRYFHKYFNSNKGRLYLVTFVVKGLLDVGSAESLILAEHLTKREHNYEIPHPYKEEITQVLKQSENLEVKYFYYSNLSC